jgi:hypothetical protein
LERGLGGDAENIRVVDIEMKLDSEVAKKPLPIRI